MVQETMDPKSKIRRAGVLDRSMEAEWEDEWSILMESTLEDVAEKVEVERDRRRMAPQM
jgi:hypothetical protein